MRDGFFHGIGRADDIPKKAPSRVIYSYHCFNISAHPTPMWEQTYAPNHSRFIERTHSARIKFPINKDSLAVVLFWCLRGRVVAGGLETRSDPLFFIGDRDWWTRKKLVTCPTRYLVLFRYPGEWPTVYIVTNYYIPPLRTSFSTA